MGLDWCLQYKPRDNDQDKEEFYRIKYKLKLYRDMLENENNKEDNVDNQDNQDNEDNQDNQDNEDNQDNQDNQDNETKVQELEEKIKELEKSFYNISITPNNSISVLTEDDIINLEKTTINGSFACNNLDFRGNVIGRSEILDENLRNEAYESHSAEECIEYAIKLEIFIENLNEEKKIECDYIVKAINWLKFWGKKGHGFYAWY
jgi:hypothetical protein